MRGAYRALREGFSVELSKQVFTATEVGAADAYIYVILKHKYEKLLKCTTRVSCTALAVNCADDDEHMQLL